MKAILNKDNTVTVEDCPFGYELTVEYKNLKPIKVILHNAAGDKIDLELETIEIERLK